MLNKTSKQIHGSVAAGPTHCPQLRVLCGPGGWGEWWGSGFLLAGCCCTSRGPGDAPCEVSSPIFVEKPPEGFPSLSFTRQGLPSLSCISPRQPLWCCIHLKFHCNCPCFCLGGAPVQRERAGSWGGTNPTADLSPLQGATSPNLPTWT